MSKLDFSISRRYLMLVGPVALSSQFDNLVGFAEIFMMRTLGSSAISAVGISRQFVMVIGITMVAVTTGTMAMVAQAIGARDDEQASATAKQSITLVFAISALISTVGYLGSPYAMQMMSLPNDVIVLGLPYLRLFFVGLPFMGVHYAISTCFHAAGDAKTPLYIALVSNVIRIAIAYVLIFGHWGFPALGVTGAAAGGLVGSGIGVAISMIALYSGRCGITITRGTSFMPEHDRARRILKIGIPSAMQGLFRNGSNLVFVKFVALTANATVALAAFSIGNQMERVVRRTSLAFGTATTALVGQSLGAGEVEEADRRGWTTLLLSFALMTVFGVPICALATDIMSVFTSDAEVIAVGVVYLWAVAAAEPFMCAAISSGGSLRAAGDTMPTLYYTLISQWLVRLPAAYVLAFPLGWDIDGIWTALVVFCALQGYLTVRKYSQGHWKTRTI
jgi:putative MATE family efflux protein